MVGFRREGVREMVLRAREVGSVLAFGETLANVEGWGGSTACA